MLHHATRWARAHADEPEFQERKRAAYRRWYLRNREFQIARVQANYWAKKIAALEHEVEAHPEGSVPVGDSNAGAQNKRLHTADDHD